MLQVEEMQIREEELEDTLVDRGCAAEGAAPDVIAGRVAFRH